MATFISDNEDKKRLGDSWFEKLVGELTQPMIEYYIEKRKQISSEKTKEQIEVDLVRFSYLSSEGLKKKFTPEHLIILRYILYIFEDEFVDKYGNNGLYQQTTGHILCILYSYIGTDEKISTEITDREIKTYYILKKVVSDINDILGFKSDGKDGIVSLMKNCLFKKNRNLKIWENLTDNDINMAIIGMFFSQFLRTPFSYYMMQVGLNEKNEKLLNFTETQFSKSIIKKNSSYILDPLINIHYLCYFFEMKEKELRDLLKITKNNPLNDIAIIMVNRQEITNLLISEDTQKDFNEEYIKQNTKICDELENGTNHLCMCRPQSGAGTKRRKRRTKIRKRRTRKRRTKRRKRRTKRRKRRTKRRKKRTRKKRTRKKRTRKKRTRKKRTRTKRR